MSADTERGLLTRAGELAETTGPAGEITESSRRGGPGLRRGGTPATHGERAPASFTQANAYLTALKRCGEPGWLNEVAPVPPQQAIRHQRAAFTVFFAGRARYPRFKSRAGRQSAGYTRPGFRWRDGQLFLAKMSTPLAFTWSWPGTGPSTVTVSRDPCGRW